MQQKNPQNSGCRKENPLKTQKSQILVVFIASGASNYFSTKEGRWSSLWEEKKQNKAKPQAPPKAWILWMWLISYTPTLGSANPLPGIDFQEDVCSHSFILIQWQTHLIFNACFMSKIMFGISKRTIFISSALTGFITPIQQHVPLEPDPFKSSWICVLLIHSGSVESKCLSQQLSCLETSFWILTSNILLLLNN